MRAGLHIARLASNSMLCFELNRMFGRFIWGAIRHRRRLLQHAEKVLLRQVQTDVDVVCVHVPGDLNIHTVVAGEIAQRLSSRGGPSSCSRHVRMHQNRTSNETQSSCCGRYKRCCSESTVDWVRPGSNPIILLHGHSMGGATWFKNIDDLIQLGFTDIYAPDLPGWGLSSRPRYRASNANAAVDYFIQPLLKWLDMLRLREYFLIGHSLGAYLAHELARLRPSCVRKVVLVAPAAISRPLPLPMALWFRLTPQRLLTYGGIIANVLFDLKFPSTEPFRAQGFRDFIRWANSIGARSGDAAAAGILRIWRPGFLSLRWRSECMRPLEENIGHLECPVVLVAGGKDCLVPLTSVRHLSKELSSQGNHVTMHVIADGDHAPHIATPDCFAKVLLMHVLPDVEPNPEVVDGYWVDTPATLARAVAPSVLRADISVNSPVAFPSGITGSPSSNLPCAIALNRDCAFPRTIIGSAATTAITTATPAILTSSVCDRRLSDVFEPSQFCDNTLEDIPLHRPFSKG